MDQGMNADRIRELMATNDMEAFGKAQYELSADDIVLEYPQSGERFVGRDKIAEMNQGYGESTGTSPSMELDRVLEPGKAWIIEGSIDYGDGVPWRAISILETNDQGRIVRQRDYFASPFEAPEWRARFTDRVAT